MHNGGLAKEWRIEQRIWQTMAKSERRERRMRVGRVVLLHHKSKRGDAFLVCAEVFYTCFVHVSLNASNIYAENVALHYGRGLATG